MQPKLINLDFWDIIAEIDREMKRIGWDTAKGRAYLKTKYGTHTRFRLSDNHLLEFRDYLKSLSPKGSSKLKLRKLKR